MLHLELDTFFIIFDKFRHTGQNQSYYTSKWDFNFKWTLFYISQKYFYKNDGLPSFWTLNFFNTIK